MFAAPVAPAADPAARAVVPVRSEAVDPCPVDVRRPAPVRPLVDRLVFPVSLVFVLPSFPSLERVPDRELVSVDVVLVVVVELVRFADRLVLDLLDDRAVSDDPVVSVESVVVASAPDRLEVD